MVDAYGVPSGFYNLLFFGSVLLLVGCVTIVLVRSVVSIYASDSKPEFALAIGALSVPILALTFDNKADEKYIEIRNAPDLTEPRESAFGTNHGNGFVSHSL